MPTCRVCKKNYRYDDSVGYSREFCGALCDGIRAGRDKVIREMRSLAVQLRAKGTESAGTEIELAFEASASSVERVCDELS